MKKLLLFIVLVITISYSNAQVTVCDFETDLATSPVIIGGSEIQTVSIVANPAPDAINMSSNVLKTTAYAIGGTPSGNKIDAIMFQLPTNVSFKANDYAAIKVNIYVEGGTTSILKPRGKTGVWIDDLTSPAPGAWIGVVKNRVDGEDGLAANQTGWMECYFDISGKTQTDDYNSFQIQMDWQDVRTQDLQMYFDDFVLVTEVPGLIPTAISNPLEESVNIYQAGSIVKVQSEIAVNEIIVTDITGRVVNQESGSDLEQVNISGLSKGIYVVTIKGEGLLYSQKIMK